MTGKSSIIPPRQAENVTIPFRDKYTVSPQFKALFREGMTLVEDTAYYLDGQGRGDARALEPPASVVYATESMRLTTRLMQLAAWLIVRRAVANGEMTPQQILNQKHKLQLSPSRVGRPKGYEDLPERLRELIEASHRLYGRILRLDGLVSEERAEPETASVHPLGAQLERIRAAFIRRAKPIG